MLPKEKCLLLFNSYLKLYIKSAHRLLYMCITDVDLPLHFTVVSDMRMYQLAWPLSLCCFIPGSGGTLLVHHGYKSSLYFADDSCRNIRHLKLLAACNQQMGGSESTDIFVGIRTVGNAALVPPSSHVLGRHCKLSKSSPNYILPYRQGSRCGSGARICQSLL